LIWFLNRAEETTVPSLPVESIMTATLVSTGYGFAVNPGDIGRSLCPLLADANLGGVARYTQIADIELS